jgi:tetratricopeptide (TPR) repeat protein
MESLSRAEKKLPGNPEVWFWKGEILALKVEKNMSREKELPIQTESLSCYEQAIWVDPKYADAHAMRAVRRLRLGKTKSLDELQNVIKMFPNCGLAYFWQGQFHFGMKRYEEAVRHWEVAEKLLPSHRSMIKESLRLARSRLKEEEATPKWLKEIQHTHTHVNAGEYDKARTEFEKIVKLLPKKIPENQAQVQWLVLFSYNYACVLSVHSEKVEKQHQKAFQDKSLYWLEIANRLGWRSWKDQCHSSGNEHMMHDEDLKSLRELPRFKKLLTYSKE